MTRDQQGLLWGAIGVLAFSFSLPATRLAVPDFGPILTSIGRGGVAALIAGIVLLIRRERFPGRQYVGGFMLVGAGVVIGFPLLTSYALRHVPASHGAVVVALLPAATAACAVLWAGERAPWPFWAAVVFGMLTVLVFAVVQGAGRPHREDALLLGAVVAAAIGYTEGGRLSRELGGWRVISWALVLTGPFCVPFIWLDVRDRTFDPSLSAWVGMAYVCVISMYVGFLFWYRGLALGGIARVGQVQLMQPVLSLIWAWLLLGEDVGWAEIGAGTLVLVSVIVTRQFRPHQPVVPDLSSYGATPPLLASEK
ncbi:MAG TPA: DMT family transporter [Thermomicrobiales bacterium]|nr:DMT family transporter [Thermomicrobiales bacterium]